MTVDLRSDTVTRPTPAMREAMARAEVGDDVYGDDPTVRALEERVAALFGKEAALFVPSGTMANQIALQLHCQRGDEVLVGEGTHCVTYESGASAALAGVQFQFVGKGGLFSADELAGGIREKHFHTPWPRLVVVENTHNSAGGRVWKREDVQAVAAVAHEAGLALHLDGARIWNASVASGESLDSLAAPFDTVSACFSKGLGAPVGSVIVGSAEARVRALRLRKMLGGAMRQVGVLAAAAAYALDHHIARLADDHRLARTLAEGLAVLPGVRCDASTCDTNIVNADFGASAPALVRALAEEGVLANASSASRIRFVTHLDVDAAAIDRALGAVKRVLSQVV